MGEPMGQGRRRSTKVGEPMGQGRRRSTKMGEPLSQSQRRSTKMGEPLRPPHTRGPAQVFQSLNRQHPLQHPLFGEKLATF